MTQIFPPMAAPAARRGRRLAPFAAAAVVIAVAATGCTTGAATTPGSTAAGQVSTDTIRTVVNADPTSFAPVEVRNADDYAVNRFLFSTLVRRDENNKIVPDLASKWDITPTRGTFTIRRGATCVDGTPITAGVVAESLKVFASPDSKSSFRPLVLGEGPATVTADDAAGTVIVELAQPWTDLLQGLSLHATGIVCPAGLADPKALTAGDVPGAFSGPYTLTKKQHGVAYTFTLRDGYKAWPEYQTEIPGTPARTIEASVNANASAVSNELLTGAKDIATIRGKDATRFDGNKDFSAQVIPQGSLYMMFNERPGHPFTDPALRKAVAQALDPTAFNQAASGGLGELYSSFAHPGVPCSNKDTGRLIKSDPAAAKAALAGVRIRMVGAQVFGPNGAANTYVAEALRAAGADIELRNVDLATWSTDLTQKLDTWDITVMGGINAGGTMYGALSTVIGTPVEKGGLNWGGLENQPALDLVSEAMTQTDDSERCGTYQEVQKLMIGDAHVIPLAGLPAQVTIRSGFAMHTMNGQPDESTMRITK
ncbi:peptide/nickel transport system substrate-binding protein [Arthrobacter ginsengisoli]|uniref:Peptide/nickel transport system substrate-binding protein n=1 Tax=Arthrobacter ginsengisoli TaxID=1356565 RepID=A0ABU1UGC0_9MICC|nr:ABC transporter substrate-binding protein [Arthrobacter ginsengisoli]MDR7084180.1 peptide/nickel transport system substrate-binding protein [Arthrobacter ginsengisoli]